MTDKGQGRGRSPAEDEEVVPVFRSWRNIYAAVVVTEIVVLLLIAAFQMWAF